MLGTPFSYSKSSAGEGSPRLGGSPRKGKLSAAASSTGAGILLEHPPKAAQSSFSIHWQRNPTRTQRGDTSPRSTASPDLPKTSKTAKENMGNSAMSRTHSHAAPHNRPYDSPRSQNSARNRAHTSAPIQGSQKMLPFIGTKRSTHRSIVSDDDNSAKTMQVSTENSPVIGLYRPRRLPHYATQEYFKVHYNPVLRPATLGYQDFIPLLDSAKSSFLLQRDVTEALIVMSKNGDENKKVLGQAGIIHELLELVDSADVKVRCNAIQTLSNLLSQEENRKEFFVVRGATELFLRLSVAKTGSGRMQPGTVLALRATIEAIAQLAHCETPGLKIRFMKSGLIVPLCELTHSHDKETRISAARGLLWVCQTPNSRKDKWNRKHDLTDMEWSSEQLLGVVSAAKSKYPDVTMQVLLGLRCLCTAHYQSIMLTRTGLMDIICDALAGDLFKNNFPLIMAAVSLVSALAENPWPEGLIEEERHVPLLSKLLSLLPQTEGEVLSMQNAKGVMATWNEVSIKQDLNTPSLPC